MKKTFVGVLALVLAAGLVGANEEEISVAGEYIETRSCDVWTGPCFSNAEFNVVGDQAIIGWMIEKGAWNGVRLDGRKIVAVLDADSTLMTSFEGEVKTGVYVDNGASCAQVKALLDMARTLAPKYLAKYNRLEKREITFTRDGLDAKLKVGDTDARVETSMLSHCDTVCGNESQAYGPFSASTTVKCAKAVEQSYRGTDGSWSFPNKRSAMVGRFAK